jgi:cell division protease FtsH
MTKEELLDRLAVMLGGRVAEEIVFHDISTGAQNDLQRASDIARSMVTEYGMSEKLGLVTFTRERQPLYLTPGTAPPRSEYSDDTARVIDEEVSRLIDESHKRVQEILTAKRDKLEAMAELLLEKETLTGEELLALLDGKEKA